MWIPEEAYHLIVGPSHLTPGSLKLVNDFSMYLGEFGKKRKKVIFYTYGSKIGTNYVIWSCRWASESLLEAGLSVGIQSRDTAVEQDPVLLCLLII